MASRAILSNLFEEQWTQTTHYIQYLSGLSRALSPTTFLEIAVCIKKLATSNFLRQQRDNLTDTLWYSWLSKNKLGDVG